jgi:hypothetical protein
MIADQVLSLTRERVKAMLSAQQLAADTPEGERRRGPRWPAGGLIELWTRGQAPGGSCWGTCRDMSEHGLCVVCSRSLEPGAAIELSLRLPELSLKADATVRHCEPCERGFAIGIEFEFAG